MISTWPSEVIASMGSGSTWLIIGLIGSVGIVGMAALLWWRWARERALHVHCPGCGTRLAYKAKSAGGRGMCPQCGERFTFPGSPSFWTRRSEAKARRLYQRAADQEKSGDIGGAILGYTAVISMVHVPAEWRARALVGRASAHWKSEAIREAVDDLEAVLHMKDAPEEVKRQARESRDTYFGRR